MLIQRNCGVGSSVFIMCLIFRALLCFLHKKIDYMRAEYAHSWKCILNKQYLDG